MEYNEENRTNIQQQLIFKYFIESIQKQQQNKSMDFSRKITEQSSNKDFLNEVFKHIQQTQKYLRNVNQQDSIDSSISTNCIPLEKHYKSNTLSIPSDINQNDVYGERRRKNNEAAKRSRDARRVKEDEIALR
jgi:hypothetical protein